MKLDKIKEHYNQQPETDRLDSPLGQLEFIRTKEIISRYLGDESLKILDVGGAVGRYSFWLAELGHQVWLLEPSERHIEIARKKNQEAEHKLAGIIHGHAGELDFEKNKFDVILNMGPMYHLQKTSQRENVLKKMYRVLKEDGILFSAYISRFASLQDGYKHGYIKNSEAYKLVKKSLATGKHNAPNNKYFTIAYFHHPEEIKPELKNAGFRDTKVLAVEGFLSLVNNLEDYFANENDRQILLEFLSEVEAEETLIGTSNHLLSIAKK